MKDLRELRTEWEGLKASGFYNHTMIEGPIDKVYCYGTDQWYEAQFDEFIEYKRASEHYSELRASADSNCPQCHGEGYLPIGITPPYLQSCSCVFRRQTVKV